MIEVVQEPTQGWKFKYDRWLRSLSRLSHALVVVSLAAVNAAEDGGRGEKSSGLMELAWNEFHSMIEHGAVGARRNELAAPLAYVWCCAGKAFDGGDDEIIRAIRIFGHPDLVTCAAGNLAVYGELSERILQVVEREIDLLIEFYRRDRKFSPDDERRIRGLLNTLKKSGRNA